MKFYTAPRFCRDCEYAARLNYPHVVRFNTEAWWRKSWPRRMPSTTSSTVTVSPVTARILEARMGTTFLRSTYCVVGGSRNDFQPMLHCCQKTSGFPFKTVERNALKSHEDNCTERPRLSDCQPRSTYSQPVSRDLRARMRVKMVDLPSRQAMKAHTRRPAGEHIMVTPIVLMP